MVNAEELQRMHIGIEWVPALNDTFAKWGMATPRQQAAFIGQCGHECGNFRILEENLNYRAATLMKLWPKRFTTLEVANQYAGNPKSIANKVYGGRMGNGTEETGEGSLYKGRGLIQLTGKTNYTLCGDALSEDFIHSPDLLLSPKYAALSAGWFYNKRGLNKEADAKDYVGMTKKINGGLIGLEDRIKHINEVLAVLDA
jgi:putative chitinase